VQSRENDNNITSEDSSEDSSQDAKPLVELKKSFMLVLEL